MCISVRQEEHSHVWLKPVQGLGAYLWTEKDQGLSLQPYWKLIQQHHCYWKKINIRTGNNSKKSNLTFHFISCLSWKNTSIQPDQCRQNLQEILSALYFSSTSSLIKVPGLHFWVCLCLCSMLISRPRLWHSHETQGQTMLFTCNSHSSNTKVQTIWKL